MAICVILLQVLITAGYFYVLWGTDFIRTMWETGVCTVLLPFSVLPLVLGVINYAFLRGPRYWDWLSSAKKGLWGIIVAQTLIVGAWVGWTVGDNASDFISVFAMHFLVAIPGFALVFLAEGERGAVGVASLLKKCLGIVLQAGILAATLYLLVWGGFKLTLLVLTWDTLLVFVVPPLILGIIGCLLLEKSLRNFFIVCVIVIQALAACLLAGDWVWGILFAIAAVLVGAVAAIPGFILAAMKSPRQRVIGAVVALAMVVVVLSFGAVKFQGGHIGWNTEKDGPTLLMLAIENEHEKLAQRFIDSRSVNIKGKDGTTALMLAFEKEYEGLAEKLLKADTKVDAQSNDGTTVLMFAIKKGYEGVAKELIAKVDVNATQSDGTTALVLAIEKGYTGLAEALIKVDADPNTKDKSGTPVLMLATEKRYTGLVKAIIKAGADPNPKDKNGISALVIFIEMGYEEIATELIKNGADVNVQHRSGLTLLAKAVVDGDVARIKSLFEAKGFDVDAKDRNGETALKHAVRNGDVEIIKLLVAKGANPNVKDDGNDVWTMLTKAVTDGNVEIVKLLLKAKADVNAKDRNGETALVHAIRGGNSEIAGLLVDAGAVEDHVSRDLRNRVEQRATPPARTVTTTTTTTRPVPTTMTTTTTRPIPTTTATTRPSSTRNVSGLEGAWKHYVNGTLLGNVAVKFNQVTGVYEMSSDRNYKGKWGRITNIRYDGQTWSFESTLDNKIIIFSLKKTNDNVFEGVVDGNQRNRWERVDAGKR